ncbi:hypothetical protein [Enterococcus sp. BWR-S5]|uniref:hypothetical protein n=1 Tax=Enterococcus sp. BWR-S5 TaxID=2787714 RepID=UPI0019218D66|nr:hypothetical protein [Enterococcus sp. BWR-S5]MBL1224579.1 hypothetical protein [Enterococcus sp. BWR-S5]MBL1224590.1 hypothetical protein [Enterococcus sp. BWR-S5]
MKAFKKIMIGLLLLVVVVFIPFFELLASLLLRLTVLTVIFAICLYLLRAVYLAFKAIQNRDTITLRKLFNIERRGRRMTTKGDSGAE